MFTRHWTTGGHTSRARHAAATGRPMTLLKAIVSLGSSITVSRLVHHASCTLHLGRRSILPAIVGVLLPIAIFILVDISSAIGINIIRTIGWGCTTSHFGV